MFAKKLRETFINYNPLALAYTLKKPLANNFLFPHNLDSSNNEKLCFNLFKRLFRQLITKDIL